MANPKLYPVVVDDFVPFCIFVVANTKAQAKKTIEEKYEWIQECGNIDYLPPFNLNEELIFGIDVEMSITEDSEDLYMWLLPDEEGYYADGFCGVRKPADLVEVEVDNDKETSEKSEEDKKDDESEAESADSDESKYDWL